MTGNLSGPAWLIILSLIWSIFALGMLAWYLWAMARLFPWIGLPRGEGWIPIWNQWRMIDRTGLPGWTVLLGFVGLGIVPYIVSIIAMHRINTEARAGAGYTVLGAVLPPLWATLLGGVLIRTGGVGGPMRSPAVAPRYAPPVYPPARGPGLSAPAPPPVPPASSPPIVPPPGRPGGSAPSPLGAPAPSAAGGAAPGPLGSPSPSQLGGASPSQLGAATDAEYERLAAEPFTAPPAAPLGAPVVREPFSWTAASRSVEPPVRPDVAPPPLHPAAAAAPLPPVVLPEPPAAESDSESPWAPAQPAEAAPAPAPATAQAANKPTGITGMFAPPAPVADEPQHPQRSEPGAAPASAAAPARSSEPEVEVEDDDLDRTIVVPRRAKVVWRLVLPDGDAFELSAPDTVIGRRPVALDGGAVLTIPDPTRTLSKSHVRLRLDGDRATVEDLGSTNGLVLLHPDGSEEQIDPGTPVEAVERMRFGTLEVTLRRVGGDE